MKNLVIREEVYDLQSSREKREWHILGKEISPIFSRVLLFEFDVE